MSRFGMTTVVRWLSEELPAGVTAYIENDGILLELHGVSGRNGKLRPEVIDLQGVISIPVDHLPGRSLKLTTPVFLSLGENLQGVPCETIARQFAPAAVGSWALNLAGETQTRECLSGKSDWF